MRAASVGVLAGLVAGAIVAGVGSRAIMKVVAVTAGPDARGMLTDNRNLVGDFTTDSLALFAIGAVLGTFGGLLYAALRAWLPRAAGGRGLLFGVLLLGAFGTAILEPDNVDFRRFGNPQLNVALFALLFLLFGVLIAPLADGIKRYIALVEGDRPPRHGSLAVTAVLVLGSVISLVPLGIAGGVILAGQEDVSVGFPRVLALFMATLVAALLGQLVAGIVGRRYRIGEDHLGPRIIGGVIVAIPLVFGLILTSRAVVTILAGI